MSIATKMRSPGLERPQLGQSVSAWHDLSPVKWLDQALSYMVSSGSQDQQDTASTEAQKLFKSLFALGLLISHQTKQVTWPESAWEGLQIFTMYPHPEFCFPRPNVFQLILTEKVNLLPVDFLAPSLFPSESQF